MIVRLEERDRRFRTRRTPVRRTGHTATLFDHDQPRRAG
jgi:hypothetical protein